MLCPSFIISGEQKDVFQNLYVRMYIMYRNVYTVFEKIMSFSNFVSPNGYNYVT